MLDSNQIRNLFPIFQARPELVFFDNASTTQKPSTVINEVNDYLIKNCANAGRSGYELSIRASQKIEQSRQKVASFLKANPSDLAFTSGATESLNNVALLWGLGNLNDGDEILVGSSDHKSSVMPWVNLQNILRGFGKNIKILPIPMHEHGDYSLQFIRDNLNERTKLLALSHVHHVFGVEMEIATIRQIVGAELLISLDCSQSVGHIPIDASKLNVDFISFSGHKMFALPGTGVLWTSQRALQKMRPIKQGSTGNSTGNTSSCSTLSTSLAEIVEFGTPNIVGILSLVPAIEFIEKLGHAEINEYLSYLSYYLYEKLRSISGIKFSPGIGSLSCSSSYGIVSFTIEDVATEDIALILESVNIMVRSGQQCRAQASSTGLVKAEDDYIRVSLHVYNSIEEIDLLINTLLQHF